MEQGEEGGRCDGDERERGGGDAVGLRQRQPGGRGDEGLRFGGLDGGGGEEEEDPDRGALDGRVQVEEVGC